MVKRKKKEHMKKERKNITKGAPPSRLRPSSPPVSSLWAPWGSRLDTERAHRGQSCRSPWFQGDLGMAVAATTVIAYGSSFEWTPYRVEAIFGVRRSEGVGMYSAP